MGSQHEDSKINKVSKKKSKSKEKVENITPSGLLNNKSLLDKYIDFLSVVFKLTFTITFWIFKIMGQITYWFLVFFFNSFLKILNYGGTTDYFDKFLITPPKILPEIDDDIDYGEYEAGVKSKPGINFDNEVSMEGVNPIIITSKAASKMLAYAKAVDSEIAGLLVIEENKGVATVTDAILYEQRAHSVGVQLNPKDLAKQLGKIAKEEPEKLAKIKGWFHSHYNFGVHWSPTDDACFASFLRVCPVAYGIVVNQAGATKARVDMKTGIGTIAIRNADFDAGKVVAMPECAIEAKAKVKQGVFGLEDFWDFWPINKFKSFGKEKEFKDKGVAPNYAKQVW